MEPSGQEPSAACDAGLVRAFDVLGKRWNGLILSVLNDRPLKFSEVRRAVGPITDSVLADRLVELVEEGIVLRSQSEDQRPQIAYSLTERGCRLQPVLEQLAAWAQGLDAVPASGRGDSAVRASARDHAAETA